MKYLEAAILDILLFFFCFSFSAIPIFIQWKIIIKKRVSSPSRGEFQFQLNKFVAIVFALLMKYYAKKAEREHGKQARQAMWDREAMFGSLCATLCRHIIFCAHLKRFIKRWRTKPKTAKAHLTNAPKWYREASTWVSQHSLRKYCFLLLKIAADRRAQILTGWRKEEGDGKGRVAI